MSGTLNRPGQPGEKNSGEVYRYLALGDSYTIGEGVPPAEGYPRQAVQLLKQEGFFFREPSILAVTGWTTGDLLSAVERWAVPEVPFDIVSLLIGVNNQYQERTLQEYEEQFIRLLAISGEFAGHRPDHVVVLSIPDYSVTPFGRASANPVVISRGIESFNEVNRKLAMQHQVLYIDITGDSREIPADQGFITEDGLHYSGKQYARWAAKLAMEIKTIIRPVS